METGLEYREIVFNVSNAKEFANTLLDTRNEAKIFLSDLSLLPEVKKI